MSIHILINIYILRLQPTITKYRPTTDFIHQKHFSHKCCYSYIAVMSWLISRFSLAAVCRFQPSLKAVALEYAKQKHSRVTAQSVSLINFGKQLSTRAGISISALIIL